MFSDPNSHLSTLIGTVNASDASPVGTWTRALVRIEDHDGVLSGRIVQLFRGPDEDPQPLCTPCTGERHNQPVFGMTILWNFHAHDGGWEGGEVLDSEEGNIYRANLHLRDDGTRLDVHGYIGVSLLGRSQIWGRVED